MANQQYPNQTGPGTKQDLGDVYFEFQQIGAQVKVCAIQASSGIEVSIIAPTSISQQQMQMNALAKLRRRVAQLLG